MSRPSSPQFSGEWCRCRWTRNLRQRCQIFVIHIHTIRCTDQALSVTITEEALEARSINLELKEGESHDGEVNR